MRKRFGVKVAWAGVLMLFASFFGFDYCVHAYPADGIFFLFAVPALFGAWLGWRAACNNFGEPT